MQDLIRQLKQDTIVQYPREVEEALQDIPVKHRRFIILTACGVSRLDAYREAYNHTLETPDNVISASASRLIAIDSNKLALEAVTRWIESRTISTDSTAASQYCYDRWLELARHDSPGVALRATELIARAAGMFVSRSEVRHIHALDTESTEAMLRNILGDLGIGDTIDAAFSVETQSNQSLATPSLGASLCPTCGQVIK
jgi:hypothetical protein